MIEAEQLVENFEMLGDWDARYQYLIDLGRQSPGLPESQKTDAHRVEGCMSNVWMQGGFGPAPDGVLDIRLDSDAIIVKGLLALFMELCNGRTRAEVLDLDLEDLFARLGLTEHLSPTRQNGLHAMIDHIRAMARLA
jgi:cysteine desulfuration protein SufE